jgi:hypothetical protein
VAILDYNALANVIEPDRLRTKAEISYLDIEGGEECFGMEPIETLTRNKSSMLGGRWLCSVKRQAG